MTAIRIVTINTAKGDLDYSERIPWLAGELARLQPDIVLLQEALRAADDSRDTTRALAEVTGLQSCFAPARRKERTVDDVVLDTWSGLAILSREPIAESTVVPLPADAADGERIALLAMVPVGSATILIANLHFTHLSGGGAADMRRREMETLLAHDWFDRERDAAIVGGDFNTRLDDLPSLTDGNPGRIFADTWVLGDGRGPRATGPAHRSPEEGWCIDFLLSVVPEGGEHPACTDSAVVLGDANDRGIYPSDHRGVMTTLVTG